MRRLSQAVSGSPIQLELDGEEVPALSGEPVAVSLLAAGTPVFSRSVKYHRPRSPFCLEGACSHCLMRVDGIPNVCVCRVPARAGMRLERQNAFPTATHDLFSAVDFLFPRGIDPHHLLAGVPVASDLLAKVTRQLAGLGRLPDHVAPALAPAETRAVDVCVVGGGCSGLAAARVLLEKRADFVVCERETELLAERLEPAQATEPARVTGLPPPLPRERALRSATALGLYEDPTGRFLAVLQTPPGARERLLLLRAKRWILATGGHAVLIPFEDNDVPGVLAGTAVLRLLRHGVLAGDRPALVGTGPALYATYRTMIEAGAAPALLLDTGAELPPGAPAEALLGDPLQAHADVAVRALSYRDRAGDTHRVECDVVAICAPPAPRFELARHAGAQVTYREDRGGFTVEIGPHGETSATGVYACGVLVGADGGASSRHTGEVAARAAWESLG